MQDTLKRRIDDVLAAASAPGGPNRSFPYLGLGDRDLFDFEMRTFFDSRWQPICHVADLAAPGQRVVARLGRVPVVVLRDLDGALRGFVNVCRHRGYPVAEDDGCGKLLVCRYHGWSYRLDGGLQRAPQADGDAGFDAEALSLEPISVAVWRGVVLGHSDADAPPPEDSHPGLAAVADRTGFDLTEYRPFRTLRMTMPTDWKLVADNTLECYHCATMHATTLSRLYETGTFAEADWRGDVRHAGAEVAGSGGRHDCIQIVPGTYLVRDTVIGIVGRFAPAGPDRTDLVFRFAAAPDADPEEAERFADVWTATLEEDRVILARQFEGLVSGRLVAGVLAEGPEACLQRTRDLVLAGYRSGLADAGARTTQNGD